MFDHCATGQRLTCLTVVDEGTRECLAIDVAGRLRSPRVIEVLAQLVSVHGVPAYLRSDNGPEFVATAILRWLSSAQIETALIDPGKAWQNATDESFNGTCRDEYLSLQWCRNRIEAQVGIDQWRRHYNEVRPHSSPGYRTPAEFNRVPLSGCRAGCVEPARRGLGHGARHLRTELVLEAFHMACRQRQPVAGVIQHSDHSCPYTSVAFGLRCQEAGIRPSMGSIGDAYDNALCESFFATLERQPHRLNMRARCPARLLGGNVSP